VPFFDVERDAVERDDPAEAERDVPYLEKGHRRRTLNRPDASWKDILRSDRERLPFGL
jgi:hypothetical protein